MNTDPIQDLKKLKQRQRDAAEMLWGDGRLRDSLPDEQAERLLDWVARYVKTELAVTVDLPDETADEHADQLLTATRRLLIQINQLVAHLPNLAEAEAERQVTQFLSRCHELTGRDVFPFRFSLLSPNRQNWDQEQVFQRIMDLLTAQPEEE